MAEEPVSFRDGHFTFPSPLPIEEVVAIDFQISFKRPSTMLLVCKNHSSKRTVYLLFIAHVVAAAVGIPVLVFLADYIILTEIVLGGAIAYFAIPRYMQAWNNLNKDGVVSIQYSDPGDLVQVQKSVFAHARGKKLIKRGLIEGEFVEEVCYCFLPNPWFNSDVFRDRMKFLGQVIYPIIVIVFPLVLTVLYMIGPVISQLQQWIKRDYFIKFLIKTAETIGEEAEDHMGRYYITRLIFRYYEYIYSWYYYLLCLALGWLQTEVALLLMKIDYMQDRYMRVFKTMKSLYGTAKKFVAGFLKVVFYPAIQLYEKTLGRYKRVVESAKPEVLLKAYEQTKKLNEEVSKVASNAKQFTPDLHQKAE